MQIPKRKPYRNAEYLDYVREHPCISCNAPGPSEPHHFMRGAGGLGMKVDDTHTVPLCRRCHACWHTEGTLPCYRMYEPEQRQSEAFMYQAQARLLSSWIQRAERGAGTDDGEELF